MVKEMAHFFIACEDQLSESLCLQLVKTFFPNSTFNPVMVAGCAGELKKKMEPFMKIAKNPDFATLILTDLDQKEDVESLIAEWKSGRATPENFLFHVSVREIESWVLADSEAFSLWSGVPKNKIPRNPDSEPDVKQTLLNLVKKYGHSKIKNDLLPSQNAKTSKVGVAYNNSLVNFIAQFWLINRARLSSPSLDNASKSLALMTNKI